MDIKLCIRGTKGYRASLKIEPNLISRIKEAQKEDVELWVVLQKSEEDKHMKFRVDNDSVMWFGDRLCVLSDPTLRGAVLSETLKDMLRSCAHEWTGNWDEYFCLVEFAYNNSWHASIKADPYELLYGRKCRAPICWNESVIFGDLDKPEFVYQDSQPGLLASIMDTSSDGPFLETCPIVWDFSDVFLKELSGIPPKRKVEFGIELVSGFTSCRALMKVASPTTVTFRSNSGLVCPRILSSGQCPCIVLPSVVVLVVVVVVSVVSSVVVVVFVVASIIVLPLSLETFSYSLIFRLNFLFHQGVGHMHSLIESNWSG
nr:retrotransposon protein, putative, Ty3-gypsy subclass [Tanacetum cinerariifolium]